MIKVHNWGCNSHCFSRQVVVKSHCWPFLFNYRSDSFAAPINDKDAPSELWEATCNPETESNCPSEGNAAGTWLTHPTILSRVNNDPDKAIVDHYVFLTKDSDPSDNVAGIAWLGTACITSKCLFEKTKMH